MNSLFKELADTALTDELVKEPLVAKNCKIDEIMPNTELINISGLIISKYASREVKVIKEQQTNTLHVFNFIIRDSKIDFISCTCWGSKEFIEELCQKLNIIQTSVRIKNARVQLKSANENNNDRFSPWTPSQYQLSISEGKSFIDVLSSDKFDDLVSVPIREHNDYYTFEDIFISDQDIIERDVNICCIIREIGEPVEIIGKNGKTYKKLDLIVFDHTRDYLKLTIWDNELISYASTWLPMVHVLFAIDVNINHNHYERSLFAVSTSRTIFTLNPCTQEGFMLYNYAKTVKLAPIIPIIEQFKSKAIKCSIEELRNLFCQDMLNSEFVLLNAVISEFNIDNNSIENCFSLRCNTCFNRIDKKAKRCYNRNCFQKSDFTRFFDCTVSISDHSSTLNNVRVTSKLIEKIFGFSLDNDPDRVLSLTSEELTNLKWKFLLERWSMLIQITTKTIEEEEQDSIKYYFKIISLEETEQY